MSGRAVPKAAEPMRLSGRLDSWKEIAAFLRVAERTAVRWEKERGLPVYRVPGGKRGAVYAETAEIDAWLRRGGNVAPTEPGGVGSLSAGGEPLPGVPPTEIGGHEEATNPLRAAATSVAPEPPNLGVPAWRRFGWSGAAVAALAVAWVWLASATGGSGAPGGPRPAAVVGMPARARIVPSERAVVAESADGRVLWRHEVSDAITSLQAPFYNLENATHVVDLDGDGQSEILASVPIHLSPESGNSEIAESRLLCFSTQGRLLWEKVFREELAFRQDRFQGPWSHGIVTSLKVGGTRRLLWSVHHWNWWPSVVLALDNQGRETGRFVHAGHIARMETSEVDGVPSVLLGGVANAYRAGFLAVLDGERLSGTGPTEVGSPYECAGCPPGAPIRYLIFEPSEVTRAAGIPYNGVHEILAFPNGYSIATTDWDMQAQVVSYFDFDLGFRLRQAGSVARLGIAHRTLEREGKLDHPWDACPERDRPPRVRSWEPARGWSELVPSS